MSHNKSKLNKLAEDFTNKYVCSNYKHHNPTIEEVKSLILDVILEVKQKEVKQKNLKHIKELKFARKCSQCDKVFNEGYCINGGEKYYCSDECLHKNISKEEWDKHYTDEGNSYWTVWEEEDFQYYADGEEFGE